MTLIGCVDLLSNTCISGWAADSGDLTLQVSVDIMVNSRRAATLRCAEFRADLRAAGIGDGCKAFQFNPAAHLQAGRNSLEVRFAGTEVTVPKGRGHWVTRRPGVSGAEGEFIAALEAYHEFQPGDHVCGIGEGAAGLEFVLRKADVPFRRYTVESLQEKTDVIICASGCKPEILRQVAKQPLNRPGLLVSHPAGLSGERLETLASWQGGKPATFAFRQIGGTPPAPTESTPILAHIHVPKCAGTSLRILLEQYFGPRYLRLYVNDTYFVYGQETLRSYLLQNPDLAGFSSHHVRVFPRWLAGREMLYVTFLRDPIQQFVSYMTHIQKHYAGITSRSLLEAVPPDAPRMTLREFARWLLTHDRDIPFRRNHNVTFFARHSSPAAADPLQAAQSTLEKFFFVGITERMEESAAKLRTRAQGAGLDFPSDPIPIENTSSDYRGDLSWIHPADEVGALLLQSVEQDRKLYTWAAARL